MKRCSFIKLKTFLNTKFWLFSSISGGSTFSDLTKQQLPLNFLSDGAGSFTSKNNYPSKFVNKRLKSLNFSRFVKLLNLTKKSSNSNLILRLARVVRFFKTDLIARRYW